MMNEDGSGLGPIVTALSPVLSFKTEKRPDQIEKTGSHPLLYVCVDHVWDTSSSTHTYTEGNNIRHTERT